MLTFYAHKFYNIGVKIQILQKSFLDNENGIPLDGQRTFVSEHLTKIREDCKEIGLAFSIAHIDRVLGILGQDDPSVIAGARVSDRIHEISVRIQDELQSSLFMQIHQDKKQYYLDPRKCFGDPILEKFPSISDDVEEAGKCFAAGRNTACVFHLSRVMESGLRIFGKTLNVPITNPCWETILQKCDTELGKPMSDRLPLWKSDDTFFSEATANLRAVKNAWRNPTMHVGRQYTDEIAEDIFRAVRGFMRHLAIKLSE